MTTLELNHGGISLVGRIVGIYIRENANPNTSHTISNRIGSGSNLEALGHLANLARRTVETKALKADQYPSASKRALATAITAGLGAIEAAAVIFHRPRVVNKVALLRRAASYQILVISRPPPVLLPELLDKFPKPPQDWDPGDDEGGVDEGED